MEVEAIPSTAAQADALLEVADVTTDVDFADADVGNMDHDAEAEEMMTDHPPPPPLEDAEMMDEGGAGGVGGPGGVGGGGQGQELELESYESENDTVASLADPAAFRSPPRVQRRDEGHQVQALGHSSAADANAEEGQEGQYGDAAGRPTNGVDAGGHSHPQAGPSSPRPNDATEGKSQSQRDGRALATQHQDDSPSSPSGSGSGGQHGREQEQTLEDTSRTSQRLTQKQRQDRGDGKEAKQTNEVNIRENGENGGVEVETDQKNTGADDADVPVSQVNVVNVVSQSDDCASNTASGASLRRPYPNKRPLREVTFGPTLSRYFQHYNARDSDSPSSSADEGDRLRAPPVRLSYDDQLYDLFCSPASLDQDAPGVDELAEERQVQAAEVLFGKLEEHHLYFNHLETLCARLHEVFPMFDDQKDEMVLVFGELGISVPEVRLRLPSVLLPPFL